MLAYMGHVEIKFVSSFIWVAPKIAFLLLYRATENSSFRHNKTNKGIFYTFFFAIVDKTAFYGKIIAL